MNTTARGQCQQHLGNVSGAQEGRVGGGFGRGAEHEHGRRVARATGRSGPAAPSRRLPASAGGVGGGRGHAYSVFVQGGRSRTLPSAHDRSPRKIPAHSRFDRLQERKIPGPVSMRAPSRTCQLGSPHGDRAGSGGLPEYHLRGGGRTAESSSCRHSSRWWSFCCWRRFAVYIAVIQARTSREEMIPAVALCLSHIDTAFHTMTVPPRPTPTGPGAGVRGSAG